MCYLNPFVDIENLTETDNGYYKFPVKWIQINSYSGKDVSSYSTCLGYAYFIHSDKKNLDSECKNILKWYKCTNSLTCGVYIYNT